MDPLKLTALRVYLGVCASMAGSPARLSGGPSYHSFDHKHSIGRILGLWLANFRVRCSIASINTSKESKGYGDRSGPRILEIDPVIQKLSRFSQVQSERERTLVTEKPFTSK